MLRFPILTPFVSLLFACTAPPPSPPPAPATARPEIVIDRVELEDARWFDRAELALMHKRQHPDGLFAAHPFAIAHNLIGQWLHGDGNKGA